MLEPDKRGIAQLAFELGLGGTIADHHRVEPFAARLEIENGRGEIVEPLFEHETTEEGKHRDIIAKAQPRAQLCIPVAGMEGFGVDAAGPDADVLAHALRPHGRRHRLARRHDMVTALVEAAKHGEQGALEKAQPIVTGIGLEPRVHRGDDRHPHAAGKPQGAAAVKQRQRNVEQVGPEGGDILAGRGRQTPGDAILLAAERQRGRGNADQVAGGLEGRCIDCRRVNPHRRPVIEQEPHQHVLGAVGPVPQAVVVAADERDAQARQVQPCAVLGVIGGPGLDGGRGAHLRGDSGTLAPSAPSAFAGRAGRM